MASSLSAATIPAGTSIQSADTTDTNPYNFDMSDMQANSDCALCCQPPTAICRSCSECPSLDARYLTYISYCSANCDWDHWLRHSIDCRIKGERHILFRMMALMQATYHVYQMHEFDRIIDRVANRHGWLYIQEDLEDRPPGFPFYGENRLFPRSITFQQYVGGERVTSLKQKLSVLKYLSRFYNRDMLYVLQVAFQGLTKTGLMEEIKLILADDDDSSTRAVLWDEYGKKIESLRSSIIVLTARDDHRYYFNLAAAHKGWYEIDDRAGPSMCRHTPAYLPWIAAEYGFETTQLSAPRSERVSPKVHATLDRVVHDWQNARGIQLRAICTSSEEGYREWGYGFLNDLQHIFPVSIRDPELFPDMEDNEESLVSVGEPVPTPPPAPSSEFAHASEPEPAAILASRPIRNTEPIPGVEDNKEHPDAIEKTAPPPQPVPRSGAEPTPAAQPKPTRNTEPTPNVEDDKEVPLAVEENAPAPPAVLVSEPELQLEPEATPIAEPESIPAERGRRRRWRDSIAKKFGRRRGEEIS